MWTRVLGLVSLGMLCVTAVWAAEGSGADWGARDPAGCTPLTQAGPPSAEQAVALMKCKREAAMASGELWLMENVVVQIGGARPYLEQYESVVMPDADVAKPVYPVRGSWTWAVCISRHDAAIGGGNPDLNCSESDVRDAKGACWQTTFGDWQCTMNGTTGATRQGTAPPR